jgi:hypothetical protein
MLLYLHYRDQMVSCVRLIVAVYAKNNVKHFRTLFGQNTEFLNVKSGGTYGYYCGL